MEALRHKVVLDVDTGIDDALALLLALNSPELEILACTTVAGNVTVEQTTRNTLAILELAERTDITVAQGAAKPLNRRLTTATYFHGKYGLGESILPEPQIKPSGIPAPYLLSELATRHKGELVVIAVGPLTNLAIAQTLDPAFGRNLKQLVIMGGAVRRAGNATPCAEANFYNDPEAAQVVMNSGANIKLVGLDVTGKALLKWSELAHLKAENLSATSQLGLELLHFYSHRYGANNGAQLHDPLAVGVVIMPELVQTERMQVEIETQGKLTRGQSIGFSTLAIDVVENVGTHDDIVAYKAEHVANAEVCLELDASAFIKLFRQRLGLE